MRLEIFMWTHPYCEQHTLRGQFVLFEGGYWPHSATASQLEVQLPAPQNFGPKSTESRRTAASRCTVRGWRTSSSRITKVDLQNKSQEEKIAYQGPHCWSSKEGTIWLIIKSRESMKRGKVTEKGGKWGTHMLKFVWRAQNQTDFDIFSRISLTWLSNLSKSRRFKYFHQYGRERRTKVEKWWQETKIWPYSQNWTTKNIASNFKRLQSDGISRIPRGQVDFRKRWTRTPSDHSMHSNGALISFLTLASARTLLTLTHCGCKVRNVAHIKSESIHRKHL
jgi:hypothetical protein